MKKLIRILAAALLIAGLFSVFAQAEGGQSLRLVCLNVGKADCMLLLWQDEAYLIDTGYWQTYPALKTALEQYGVTRLRGVFLTHCHKDHAGGLMDLAKSDIAVDAWYAAAIYYDVKEGEHPAELAAKERGENVDWLSAGDVISCAGGASFTVLGPLTVNTDNENNNSLVMRFASGAGSILFTGDMKDDEEYELLDSFLPCDVLKVGHHGDNNATFSDMLSVVRPKVSLILTSTQEEPDTPASSTLKRLAAAGSKVYISQEMDDAMMVTLTDGDPAVENVRWNGVPEKIRGLTLSINLSDDTVTLANTGDQSVSLKGCRLFSTKGEEMLLLPEITLTAGQSFVIGTKTTKGAVDYQWNDKKVWHQSKRDMAILYDAYGRALARTDNGFDE